MPLPLPPAMIDQAEQDAQVAALKQWLVSQEIHPAFWTPLCMNLAAWDIATSTKGRPYGTLSLLESAIEMLVLQAKRYYFHG